MWFAAGSESCPMSPRDCSGADCATAPDLPTLRCRFSGRRSILTRPGVKVKFCVKYRFCGRRRTFAGSGADRQIYRRIDKEIDRQHKWREREGNTRKRKKERQKEIPKIKQERKQARNEKRKERKERKKEG